MKLFGRKRQRVVVKEYGRNSLFALALWPVALLLGRQGMENRQAAQVRDMERDALAMRKLGYRIVSTQEYTMPLLSISYLRVTYELTDGAQ